MSLKETFHEISHDLKTENKELKCLYGILNIIGDRDATLEDIFNAATDLIAESARYPEITAVRIRFGEKTYMNRDFIEGQRKLAADIAFREEKVGSIEVFHTDDRETVGESPPPLKEQSALIDSIARIIGRIAESKKDEKILKENERRYRRLMENAKDVIFRMSLPDCVFEYVSPAATEISGYSPDDFYRTPLFIRQIIHPDCKGQFEENLSNLFSGEMQPFYEYKIKHKSGEDRWINHRNVLIRDRNGTPVAIEGIVTDVTERKRAEKRLENERSRLKHILDNIPLMIAFVKPNGMFSWVNKIWEKKFGWSSKETKEMNVFNFLCPDQKCQKHAKKFIEKADGTWGDFTPRTRDGKEILTRWTNISLSDGSKIGIGDDVTERRLAEKSRRRLEQQLNQARKMEAIGTLAAGIAHDFNNILASVLGFTELCLGQVEKGSSLEDNLNEVLIAGNRAAGLVKQILAFARQADDAIRPVQVSTIAREVLKLLRSPIPSTIEIRQKIASDSLVMGNPVQIHQIFMNICTNAAQAMKKNGGVMEVSVTDVRLEPDFTCRYPDLDPGDYIEIAISDTGEGIDPEIVGSVFDPYFTTKMAAGGSGMGLATVHGIVKTHKGEITVESKEGKGSVFTVYLPVSKKRTESLHRDDSKTINGTESILFVDDELAIAKMGGRILERLGYKTTVRTSSIEALELFRSKPYEFDLVITDLTMPNMTGDRLAAEIAKIRPQMPIVLCTGYGKQITESKAFEKGIGAIAYKPLVKTDLAKAVRKLLDDRNK